MKTVSVRRLSAILAADVVGYSRMMGEDEARTLRALRSLRDEILVPKVEAQGGHVVKSLGDGWLVSFESSMAAVTCALSIQDALAQAAAMRLRVGIHVGDVTFEDGDVYGDGVNVAARLEAVAAPGGVAISDTVWSSLDGTLRTGFSDQGLQNLKNIAAPVRVWSLDGEAGRAWPTTEEAGRQEPQVKPKTSAPITLSVAAFAATGAEPDLAALAEGMAEDLVTDLSRFRWLDVVQSASGTSARYQLAGTIRGSGQRLRITAHLTDSENGRRFWSEKWDRAAEDLFALQDELVSAMIARATAEIELYEKLLLGSRPLESLSARELGLRANALVMTGDVTAYEEASHLVARAIELEPENPDAQTQRALVDYRKACSGAWPPRELLLSGQEAAREAIKLDPRRASAYGVLAAIQGMLGDTNRAIDAANRIAELNPHAWGAPHCRAIALTFAPPNWVKDPAAHAEDLLDDAEETLRLAPATAYRAGHFFHKALGILMRDQASDLTEAIAALDHSATEPGATWWPLVFIALAELRHGDEAAAREKVQEALEGFPSLTLSVFEAMFGASHVAAVWRPEIDRLPEIGVPRG